ncbi:MAG: FecR domain-containing protein [Rhodospirillaceae bacterium]|nr:FecR domain-containing protein [Rhodospirillaceae bacterium]
MTHQRIAKAMPGTMIGNSIGCFFLLFVLLWLGFAPTQAISAEQVGVAAAVRGQVSLAPREGASRPAVSGGDVNFQDIVKSGENSGLQVMLLDETTLTVGPNAEMIIDEMVYDPAGVSSLAITVLSGGFRYVSGAIASQNPENVSISTPVGHLGIRGTNLAAVKLNGGWFFGLFGPGPKNNTGNKAGGFVFSSPAGDREVRRAGFGFSVNPGQAPGEIVAIPDEIVMQFQTRTIVGALAKKPGQGEENGQGEQASSEGQGDDDSGSITAAESESGQVVAETQEESIAVLVAIDAENLANEQIDTAAQEILIDDQITVLTGVDMAGYSGSAVYTKAGIAINAIPFPDDAANYLTPAQEAETIAMHQNHNGGAQVGTFDISVTANFSARTIIGSFSNIDAASFGINGETLTINETYTASGNSMVQVRPYKTGVGSGGAYNLDTDIDFLKNGTSTPRLYTDFMITDSSWVDQAAGDAIVDAQ